MEFAIARQNSSGAAAGNLTRVLAGLTCLHMGSEPFQFASGMVPGGQTIFSKDPGTLQTAFPANRSPGVGEKFLSAHFEPISHTTRFVSNPAIYAMLEGKELRRALAKWSVIVVSDQCGGGGRPSPAAFDLGSPDFDLGLD